VCIMTRKAFLSVEVCNFSDLSHCHLLLIMCIVRICHFKCVSNFIAISVRTVLYV